jgi:putative transposase
MAVRTPLEENLGRWGVRGETLARWCAEYGGWDLKVVERDNKTQGFTVLPRRWVVERSFGWLVRNRRLRADYERKVRTSETLVEIAIIRLLLRRHTATA